MKLIEERTANYAQHPLFAFLSDRSIEPEQRLAFAPSVAHYIMTFADLCKHVFREEPAKDRLQELVNAQTYEEAEHCKWFLADLGKLGADPSLKLSDALTFLWSDVTAKSRTLSYHLCRLTFGADALRKLVVVHCVEATAEVTIKHVMAVGKEWTVKHGRELEFFGRAHDDAEDDHSLWDQQTRDFVLGLKLEMSVKDELLGVIDQTFNAYLDFAQEILTCAKSGPSMVSAR
jgi:hypothetical protein